MIPSGVEQGEVAPLVIADVIRITVMGDVLVRIEHDPLGRFDDGATLTFAQRESAISEAVIERRDGEVVVRTGAMELRYTGDGAPPSAENLEIHFELAGERAAWHPGMDGSGNLLGTMRTLDGVSGASDLEQGLLSRDGWVLIDDSKTPRFAPGDDVLFEPAPGGGYTDWYLLCPGRAYEKGLAAFTDASGPIPMPPRYMFGAWWSRYWPYSEDELKGLIGEFEANDVPLDVLVIDMDWHLDGWTGYTWNPKYFPEPERFLDWAHDKGLRVTLNLHPADGVGKHERAFDAFADYMGADKSKVYRIPFDCTDPRYMKGYFELLHHPLQRQGIDFWWMDWQQGDETAVAGLDPLFALNVSHWQDMIENKNALYRDEREQGAQRPVNFSRWGGLGNHRYPVGFSGDTYCDWASLSFQPFFTSTASNVGFGYWSHDIGGHQPGPVEDELYTRWVQFGALSPVLRTHTGRRVDAERRLWAFGEPYFLAKREAFHLRYRMVPYLYTAARMAMDTSVSMCRPMYYAHSELDVAYGCPDQYMLGEDLLVAPVLSAGDSAGGNAQVRVWLPAGVWRHWFTGRVYESGAGGRWVEVCTPLDEIPLFIRAGSVVFTAGGGGRRAAALPEVVVLDIETSTDGSGAMYEDDGFTALYGDGAFAWTRARHEKRGADREIVIEAVDGSFEGMQEKRSYTVRLLGVSGADAVEVNGEAVDAEFDSRDGALVIKLPARDVREETRIIVRCERADGSMDGHAGRVRTLGRVAWALGDTTPDAVRGLLESGSDDDGVYGVRVLEGWTGVIGAVGALDQSVGGREAALCHLLGATCWMHATGNGDGSTRIGADVVLSVPADSLGAIDVRVRVEHERGGGAMGEARGVVEREGVVGVRCELAAEDRFSPHGVLATARFGIGEGGITETVRFRKTVFPSIGAWWVVGAFDCPHDRELERVFEPEMGFELTDVYEGKDGEAIRWRLIERPGGLSPDEEFVVDLNSALEGAHTQSAAYAATWVECPEEREAVLAFGSDDGVVVWVNGREVHRHHVMRGYSPREDRVGVRLRTGENLIVMKIGQAEGEWAFGLHIEHQDGAPMTDLRVTARGKHGDGSE